MLYSLFEGLEIIQDVNSMRINHMLLVCIRMYLYVIVWYSYVPRMYLYVTRMLLVCICMLLVCYSYVLVCYSYVTRMLLVVPVCSFSHDHSQLSVSGWITFYLKTLEMSA